MKLHTPIQFKTVILIHELTDALNSPYYRNHEKEQLRLAQDVQKLMVADIEEIEVTAVITNFYEGNCGSYWNPPEPAEVEFQVIDNDLKDYPWLSDMFLEFFLDEFYASEKVYETAMEVMDKHLEAEYDKHAAMMEDYYDYKNSVYEESKS